MQLDRGPKGLHVKRHVGLDLVGTATLGVNAAAACGGSNVFFYLIRFHMSPLHLPVLFS